MDTWTLGVEQPDLILTVALLWEVVRPDELQQSYPTKIITFMF